MTALLVALAVGLVLALAVRVIRAGWIVDTMLDVGPGTCEFCEHVATGAVRLWRHTRRGDRYVRHCDRHLGAAVERLKR